MFCDRVKLVSQEKGQGTVSCVKSRDDSLPALSLFVLLLKQYQVAVREVREVREDRGSQFTLAAWFLASQPTPWAISSAHSGCVWAAARLQAGGLNAQTVSWPTL